MPMNMFLYMSESNMKAPGDPFSDKYGSGDGITTDPTDPNRITAVADGSLPGAIKIVSFKLSVDAICEEEGGRPRSVVHIQHGDVEIGKDSDSRSPALFKLISRGSFISEATVFFRFNTKKPFLIYHMSFVHIVSYLVETPTRYTAADGTGDFASQVFPAETIKLRYGQMRVIFRQEEVDIAEYPNDDRSKGIADESHSLVMQIPAMWSALPGRAGKARNDDKP